MVKLKYNLVEKMKKVYVVKVDVNEVGRKRANLDRRKARGYSS